MSNTNIISKKGFGIFLFERFVDFDFTIKKAKAIPSEGLKTITPNLTHHRPLLREGLFHYVFMVRRSVEVHHLLGFHANSIVERGALLKKSSRSESLRAGGEENKRWRAAEREEGSEDERGREAGHNAKCRQGGASESAGYFNLWIHCFPLYHQTSILCRLIKLSQSSNSIKPFKPPFHLKSILSSMISTDLLTTLK